jgi:hypothetical protein
METSSNAIWLAAQYGSRQNHPVYGSRSQEFRTCKALAEHWGRELTEQDFDEAIAIRFGGGVEFEWGND